MAADRPAVTTGRRTSTDVVAGLRITPAAATLGAEISGADLARPLDRDTKAAIDAAWAEHLVLLWRDQTLTVDQHVAFGRQFGELEDMAHVALSDDLPREVLVVANDPALNGAAVAPEAYRQGFKYHPVQWHSDNSYRPIPPKGSALYVRESPPVGGATLFADMYAACEALPPDLRRLIDGREQIHDPSLNSANVLRRGATPPADVSQGRGPRHPLIRRHPVTGRCALYLGRRPYAYICGYSVGDSEATLDRLWRHATEPRFVWQRETNRAGDLFLWDNRCTMHARDGLNPAARRLAHRVQILGERPIAG
ncbi:MAG: TauD/TfdA family dioxygenase [Alphaproteobacteria bacterium]|nr:TauD/TfdA family dioxygenase [Alphaproteobacteria bacterium]